MPWKVIQFEDPTGQVIVARVPPQGTAELVSDTQLIVQEGQIAAFFHEGRPADGFKAGRYNLTAKNLPVLNKILNLASLGASPFQSYLYFVALKTFTDLQWSTVSPIPFQDSKFGTVPLDAQGTFAIRIGDPKVFLHISVRSQGIETSLALEEYLRKIIVSRLAQVLPEVMTAVLDLPSQSQEIALRMKNAVRADFEQYGVTLADLTIKTITLPPAVQEAIDQASPAQTVSESIVPDVVGMTGPDAAMAVEAAGSLTVNTVEQYSDTVIAGLVISQEPKGGTSVSPGSSVNLVISQGKPHTPDVVDTMAADTDAAIETDIAAEAVTANHNDTETAGKAIRQSPPAKKEIAAGLKVDYAKSPGKPIVPNIFGMKIIAANKAVAKVHLVVGAVTTAYDNHIAAGNVISQKPSAGTAVAAGSKVNYTKSLGKPIVPNIVGKKDVSARMAITSVDNLKVGTVTTAYSNTAAAGTVISQRPAAGKKVSTGSSVNYVKSLGKKAKKTSVRRKAAR